MIFSSAPIIGKVPKFKQKAGFKRGISWRDQEKPEETVRNTLEMRDDDIAEEDEDKFQPRQEEFKLPTPKQRPTSKSDPWRIAKEGYWLITYLSILSLRFPKMVPHHAVLNKESNLFIDLMQSIAQCLL